VDGIKFGIVLSIMGLLGVSSCRMSTTAEYAAFGDSVTWGYGGLPGGWVLQLEGKSGMEIINLGNPGETSAGGVDRIDEALLVAPSANTVIIAHGGNDWVSAFRSAPCNQSCSSDSVSEKYDQAGDNLMAIYRKVAATGRRAVFSTYWPTAPAACKEYSEDQFALYQEHLRRLNREISDVAARTGSLVMRLDELTEIADRPENFFDCLHPNEDGYALIAEFWLPLFE
jgi:lysophospholipase L1-like esterase